ncbi:hypothetical protein GJ700_03030 [Duganella sp. FT92W]|uniref:Uncharacterized protein n=1 Tax=Pseudoduganella rivuli TaxID=2666085 RepID=A0A7X2IIZ4_9BURK|nr:hypothetical protein [Pseudoduganella rivuli]MRV70690.1 hypothetical protein [Pseudoduganella rivuli]
MPRADVVQKADMLYPGSAAVLNHVIWEVLRTGTSVEKKARTWVGQLDPGIQKAVVKAGRQFGDDSRTLKMLERRPGLDSLAVLVILFRSYRETENAKDNPRSAEGVQAWGYACAILRMLFTLGPAFATGKVQKTVFELFVQRVFSGLTSFWGAQMRVEDFDYVKAVQQLQNFATQAQIHDGMPLHQGAPLSDNDLYRLTVLIHDLLHQAAFNGQREVEVNHF